MRKNTVTQTQIDKIFKNSTFEKFTVFDKCTVVVMKLPNGFILVESSACVDPENYNFETGVHACKERLKNKLWELEGYTLQEKLYCEPQIAEFLEKHLTIRADTVNVEKADIYIEKAEG